MTQHIPQGRNLGGGGGGGGGRQGGGNWPQQNITSKGYTMLNMATCLCLYIK